MGDEDTKKYRIRKPLIKLIIYSVLLTIILVLCMLLYNITTIELLPDILKPIGPFIIEIRPYIIYIQAIIILILGWLIISSISSIIYKYARKVTEHKTASAIRMITKIFGFAILLSIISSVLSLEPAAALTIGSFTGLIIGFATQNILSHGIAGIFILLSKPFITGDTIEISGQKGIVKDMTLMRVILESENGEEILIPNGMILSKIIKRKRSENQD